MDKHATPSAVDRWRANGMVDRDVWCHAGDAGLLCPSMPVEYGGAGGDFRHEAALVRQLVRRGLDGWGVPLHNGIVAPYILEYGNSAQRDKWLPKLASGDWVGAIAMTEPRTGSDLQAIRTWAVKDGDHY